MENFVQEAVVYVAINAHFLKKNGQTIGEKAMKIKVVNADGSQENLKSLIVKRYIPFTAVAQISLIGGLISFINILFIFGKDKRCLNDLLCRDKSSRCLIYICPSFTRAFL